MSVCFTENKSLKKQIHPTAIVFLSPNFSLMKRVDRNTGFCSVETIACVSSKQTKRKYVATFILSDTALTPLLPFITEDMWYMRLCNCSVTTSMCLQAQCLLCCYYSFKLAGPVGWTRGSILTLSLYKSPERENGVGPTGQSGWRWADLPQVLSTLSSDHVTSLVNTV